MKLLTWNVNGLRAVVGKNFLEFFNSIDADTFGINEIKLSEGQLNLDLPGYEQYYNYAEKKGYSGTALFSKVKPLSISFAQEIEEFKSEGRVINAEYDDFYLITVYAPNSQDELKRLDFKRAFNKALLNYAKELNKTKGVIITGDLNVAHREIDLKNPKTNHFSAGFSDEEREDFSTFIANGFTDSFRAVKGDEIKYSWWSYRFKAREKNTGWRIDYFLVSDDIKDRIVNADILTDVLGSDHAPIILEIK